jgi:dienelactone hydrolase
MIAHRLAARGHQAFRFNYRGCGESTGKAGRFRLDELFTEDAVGAATWLKERGVERFLYSGSCFGARTALEAASEEPGATGVVVFAMPMSDYASGERGARKAAAAPMTSLTKRAMQRKTLRGLRDRDVRSLYAEMLRHKIRRLLHPRRAASEGIEVSPVLLRSLATLIERRVPLLFVYGESDSAYKEFLEARNGTVGRLLEKAGDRVEVRVIPGRLHGWVSIPAGEAAVDLIVDWVSRVDHPTPVP